MSVTSKPSLWVCKPAYLVPGPSQDNLGGLRQQGHLAYKWGNDTAGSLISPDGVVLSQIFGMPASVIFKGMETVQVTPLRRTLALSL